MTIGDEEYSQLREAIHELNNMLHVIVGMNSLLIEDLSDLPDQLELARMVGDAGQRSSALVARISDLTRRPES